MTVVLTAWFSGKRPSPCTPESVNTASLNWAAPSAPAMWSSRRLLPVLSEARLTFTVPPALVRSSGLRSSAALTWAVLPCTGTMMTR